jgi:hypothetical protein
LSINLVLDIVWPVARKSTAPKAIKDYFYETRVLMGRDFTVKRFAAETLGGAVDPVMLGYIEKGKRFPKRGAGAPPPRAPRRAGDRTAGRPLS